MFKILYVIITTLSFTMLFSQQHGGKGGQPPAKEGVLSGKVVDDQEVPVSYVTITLFKLKDSSVVTGGVTADDGTFKIVNIPKGRYFCKLDFIGFVPDTISNLKFPTGTEVYDLGTIKLEKNPEMLGAVEISAEEEYVSNGIDRKVYNVDKNIASTGGTAEDLLQNIPSVEVDPNEGTIELRGSGGVQILIDGKPSNLTADGGNFLDQIPAGSIERVEVITNPSAKYDPDGMSGIINIVLKKNKLQGFTGGVNLGAGYNNKFDASGNIAYRNSIVNVYTNYSFNLYNGYRNYTQDQLYYGEDSTISSLNSARDGSDSKNTQGWTLGSDFYLNKNSTLGFSSKFRYSERERYGDIAYNSYDPIADSAFWNRITLEPRDYRGWDFDLYYEYIFPKNRKNNVLVDLTHGFGSSNIYGNYDEYHYDNDFILYDTASLFQSTLEQQKNRTTQAAVDVTQNLNEKMKLEYGTKALIRSNDNDFYSESALSDKVFTPDTNLNNNFIYNEQIYSLYGIWGHKIKDFSYQVGMRLEQAFTNSLLATTNDKYVNNYFSFFPSVHLQYVKDYKHQFQVSYSRRINRPRSRALNPFTNYTDPYNLRRGNPYLDPEYVESLELSYGFYDKKVTATGSVYGRYTTDKISRIRFVDSNGVSVSTYDNVDNAFVYGVELVGMYKPIDWFRWNLSFNLNQTFYIDAREEFNFNNSGFGYTIKSTFDFNFWKDMNVQLNGWFSGKRVLTQGYALPMGSIDFAVKKGFLKGKGSIGFRVSDIFNTRNWHMIIDQPGFTQDAEYDWESRQFWVNFSYKFGQLKSGGKRRKKSYNGGGMDDGGDF